MMADDGSSLKGEKRMKGTRATTASNEILEFRCSLGCYSLVCYALQTVLFSGIEQLGFIFLFCEKVWNTEGST